MPIPNNLRPLHKKKRHDYNSDHAAKMRRKKKDRATLKPGENIGGRTTRRRRG